MKHFLLFLLCFSILIGRAEGTEIKIPHLKVKHNEQVNMPIIIDNADNLAGIKLVIDYDKELLSFKEGNPSSAARSLMFVINDKNPGKLIIVMAGAKGISGKNLSLVVLSFTAKNNSREVISTRLKIMEYQLMSDQLKDIKSEVSVEPLDIIP